MGLVGLNSVVGYQAMTYIGYQGNGIGELQRFTDVRSFKEQDSKTQTKQCSLLCVVKQSISLHEENMKTILSFLFVVFLSCFLQCRMAMAKEIVTIAALAPMTGEWDVGRTTAAAIPIAVEDINNDTSLLPNHDLQFVFGNTNCSSLTALPIVMNFWAAQKRNVDAFIGGGCNHVCEYISLLAGKWNLPVVSWGCMSGHLSNRITFPTFARTVGKSGVFFSFFGFFSFFLSNCCLICLSCF